MNTPLNIPKASTRVACIALVKGRKCGCKPTVNKLCINHMEELFKIFAPERVVR